MSEKRRFPEIQKKKRIFVFKDVSTKSEYSIYEGHSSSDVINLVNNYYHHSCPNFGNKVWFQGIMSAIYNENTEFGFLYKGITSDYINNNYDLVLLPMANIFNTEYFYFIQSLDKFFSKIKIPTVVMSCGVQANSYSDLDKLIYEIGEDSKRFIANIYSNGGTFGVRGEFTKLFFEKLGFDNVTVTGCPSIYQNGDSLSIVKKLVSPEEFKYIVNGSVNSFAELFSDKKSVYIDQDSMYPLLFGEIDNTDVSTLIKQLIKQYGLLSIRLASEGRTQLFANPNDWRKYIINNEFSFSIGSRIHGSVMSILSGVPTAMCPIDSRTQEMAEFYKIPIIDRKKLNCNSIYDLYYNLDFSEFNKQYKKNYEYYCEFLVNSGLTDNVNRNNIFFDMNKEYYISSYPNEELLFNIRKELETNLKKYKRYENCLNIKRKVTASLK